MGGTSSYIPHFQLSANQQDWVQIGVRNYDEHQLSVIIKKAEYIARLDTERMRIIGKMKEDNFTFEEPAEQNQKDLFRQFVHNSVAY